MKAEYRTKIFRTVCTGADEHRAVKNLVQAMTIGETDPVEVSRWFCKNSDKIMLDGEPLSAETISDIEKEL